jgi:hypothetical protein
LMLRAVEPFGKLGTNFSFGLAIDGPPSTNASCGGTVRRQALFSTPNPIPRPLESTASAKRPSKVRR